MTLTFYFPQWEDPIGEVPEFPRSKTVQSVVEGAADSLWR